MTQLNRTRYEALSRTVQNRLRAGTHACSPRVSERVLRNSNIAFAIQFETVKNIICVTFYVFPNNLILCGSVKIKKYILTVFFTNE